jgi:hypothetical protein
VLVLELRPPELPTSKALLSLWPTWLSYAVSYLFIAIVWANHHHLMRYATEAAPRLMWSNFAHLFSVSLLPLSTAWMAVSELAPQPVAFTGRSRWTRPIPPLRIRSRRGALKIFAVNLSPVVSDQFACSDRSSQSSKIWGHHYDKAQPVALSLRRRSLGRCQPGMGRRRLGGMGRQ